jgi:hypothetical protein
MADRVHTGEYVLTPKDLGRFSVRVYRHIVILFTLVVLAYLMIALLKLGAPIVLALVLSSLGVLAVYILIPITMQALLSRPKHAIQFRPRYLEVNDGILRQRIEPGVESSVPLNQFLSARLLGDYYALTLAPGQHLPVPVSAFESLDDQGDFEELLRTHVKRVSGF